MRVLTSFLVAVAALTVGAAMAPGAWAAGSLAMTMSGTPSPLIIGDTVTITGIVTNASDQTATGVKLNFQNNGKGDLTTAPDPGFCSDYPTARAVICPLLDSLITLAPGASIQASVVLTGFDLDFPINVIGNAQSDNVTGSGFLSWTSPVEPKADIKLDLSASSDAIVNGAVVTIKALVSNTTSQATAYGSTVTFTLPPEVEIVSQPDGCSGTRLNLTCPVGDLGPQLTAQRLLTLRSTQEGAFTVLAAAKWARPNVTDTKTQTTVSVLPPPDPTPDPTPAPAPTPVSTKAHAASFATLVSGAPATGRCMRARKLSIVLRSIKGVDPVRATIRVTGRKHALVLKGSKAQRPFSLKLPRSGRATVSLTVTLESGRRYTSRRTYRLC